MILHAGLIARFEAGRWRGVLIEGASGSGKSDLALRAIEAGWSMVADDRTLVWTCEGRLYGRAAPVLDGLVEVRGLGVVTEARRRDFAPVHLVVRCADMVDRAPEFQARDILSIEIPSLDLVAREASATAKLAHALSLLGLPAQPAYQASRAGPGWPATGRGPVRFRA
jgi:serine kinase of HPr protein (carbohydrate metabolism regulator)